MKLKYHRYEQKHKNINFEIIVLTDERINEGEGDGYCRWRKPLVAFKK